MPASLLLTEPAIKPSVLPPREESSSRLLSIQALRFLAAFAVFGIHMGLGRTDWFSVPAVQVFFVISGYIMVASTERDSSWVSFARKRIARVVPLYWAVTLATFAGVLAYPKLFSGTSADPVGLLKSLLFVPFRRADGVACPLVYLGWTLNYEMLFYAIFAVCMAVAYRHRTFVASGIIVTMYLLGLVFQPTSAILETWTQPSLLFFAIGMILRPLHRPLCQMLFALVRRSFTTAIILRVLSAASVVGFAAVDSGPLAFVLVTCVFTFALLSEDARAIRSAAAVGLLGDLTYSIYLAHPFIANAVVRLVLPRVSHSLPLTIAVIALSCAAVIGTSWACFRFFERPAQQWLTARLGGRKK